MLWARTGREAYDAAVAEVWTLPPVAAGVALAEAAPALVHAAVLAANGHNTQPWRFILAPDGIAIRPDFSRRTPVVDPDDHHLYASLGCAAENLVTAAAASGFAAGVEAGPEGVFVHLDPAPPQSSPRAAAIPRRQCVRFDYDGRPVASDEVAALLAAAGVPGVAGEIFTDRRDIDRITDLVVAGNSVQMGDPAFMAELTQWVRFNGHQAATTRDGLFAGATGAPEVAAWLGRRLFDVAVSADGENAKYHRQLASSAGVMVLVADTDDPAGWIAAGRAAQRFALEATVLDLRYASVNQPVEVLSVRPDLMRFLGT
ncbi:MAG: hypothetical protein JNK88_07480, partial [Mangrovicoccus sp.]|nr:hypothetical protein [Mangrovicoccus sp.]